MAMAEQAPENRPGSYEELWPPLAARLEVALRARGVSGALRDDVIQETAARLWERWSRVDTGSDVFPLAFTIARNLVTDRARERDCLDLYEIARRPSPEDPYESAVSRIELGRVMKALRSLTPRYRDLLLAEAGWKPDDAREPGGVVTNMARMRARKRLRAALEQAGAAVVLPWRRLRERLFGRGAETRLQFGQVFSGCALEVVLACVLSTVGAGVAAGISDDGAPTPRLRAATLAGALDHRAPSSRAGTPAGRASTPRGETARPASGARAKSGIGGVGLGPLRVPHSRGRGEDSGSFGLWGYDMEGHGEGNVAGEDLTWRYENRYKNPRCVSALEEEEVSTDCSGGEAPRGSAEVGYGDHSQTVEYGN